MRNPFTLLRCSKTSLLLAAMVATMAGATALAQDTRTVTEPVFPAVCTQIAAETTISAGEPASETNDTSIQAALISAACAGKAVELIASGSNDAFVIAPIYIPSGVTLLVDGGVTVFGSKNAADYQIGTVSGSQDQCGTVGSNGNGCNPLITIGESSVNGTSTSTGSGLMGYGVINGRGQDKPLVNGATSSNSWWDLANVARSGGSQNNPVMVVGYKANSGLMYKITLLNSPHFHVSIHYNNGFTAWGIKILTPFTARNSDGFDPSGVSNVTISNSVIGDGDDEIAIGGSSTATDITFQNLLLTSGHGLSIGSITSSGVSNVYANNINFSGQAADNNQEGLHIKSDCGNGGTVSNVSYNNVCIQNVLQPINLDPNYDNPSSCGTSNLPQYTNISYNNVHELAGTLAGVTINFQGYGSSNVSTISFDNVVFDTPNSKITATAKYDTIALAGNVYPSVLQSLNTVSGSTGVSYTGSATETSTPSFSCPTSGTANVFPALVGELYASYGTLNNANQAFSTTDAATVTLNAMVQPTNSETSYSYTNEGSYTGVAAPSAGVQFYDGGVAVGAVVALGKNGTLASLAIANPAVGTHTYTAQYVGDTNYSAQSFGSLTVTVSAGTATQLAYTTAPSNPVIYGTAPGTVKVAVEDAQGAQTTSTASVTLTVTGPNSYSHVYTASAVSGIANFTISSSLPAVGVYSYVATSSGLASATAGETVSAATLTVAAQPASRTFDTANPAFTYTITGYVNGDTSSVVSGAATLTTTAVRSSPAGMYPIMAAQGTLSAANYVFSLTGNTLTVTGGAAQTVIFAALPNFPSGTSYQLTARTTSGIAATYSVTGPATVSGATLTVNGPGAVTLTASAAANGNYAAAANVQRSFTAQ
jgi:polygalacturonase